MKCDACRVSTIPADRNGPAVSISIPSFKKEGDSRGILSAMPCAVLNLMTLPPGRLFCLVLRRFKPAVIHVGAFRLLHHKLKLSKRSDMVSANKNGRTKWPVRLQLIFSMSLIPVQGVRTVPAPRISHRRLLPGRRSR